MGNLTSICKRKKNYNLLLYKKCIHCGTLFNTMKKRRKHEIICSKKNEDEALHIYYDQPIYSDQTIYQS